MRTIYHFSLFTRILHRRANHARPKSSIYPCRVHFCQHDHDWQAYGTFPHNTHTGISDEPIFFYAPRDGTFPSSLFPTTASNPMSRWILHRQKAPTLPLTRVVSSYVLLSRVLFLGTHRHYRSHLELGQRCGFSAVLERPYSHVQARGCKEALESERRRL